MCRKRRPTSFLTLRALPSEAALGARSLLPWCWRFPLRAPKDEGGDERDYIQAKDDGALDAVTGRDEIGPASKADQRDQERTRQPQSFARDRRVEFSLFHD